MPQIAPHAGRCREGLQAELYVTPSMLANGKARLGKDRVAFFYP